jgi:protein SCO1/2
MTAWGGVFGSVKSTAMALAIAVLPLLASPASAQYNRQPESDVDPSIFRIDEQQYLGTKIDANFELIDEQGRTFKIGDLLGEKPLILVLAYYQCDGTCSVVNTDLRNLLQQVEWAEVGKDYRILTITFDKLDTLGTLKNFRDTLDLPPYWLKGWTFALPKDPESIKRLTSSIGFKYWWSYQDRTFFHPGVFAFLSQEGRVTRFLYSLSTNPRDVELALIEAQQNKLRVGDAINYAISLCYSYNYKEGSYTYNIPLFVGAGSMLFGVTSFAISVFVYRRHRRRRREAII